MKSRKQIAKVFQKWVYEVVKSIRTTGSYEMTDMDQVRRESLHDVLTEQYSNKYVVYVGFIKYIGNKTLIKVGSTHSLKTRIAGLRKEFGSCFYMKIYECSANTKCEKFMRMKLKEFAYKESINGHKSTELFLMNDDDIKKMYLIFSANLNKFKTLEDDVDLNEVHIDEVENSIVSELKEELKNHITETIMNQEKEKTKEEKVEKCTSFLEKEKKISSSGPKYQIYSVDGSQLIKTYESLIAPERDFETFGSDHPCRSRIKTAVKNKQVYKKYRWATLERHLDDTTFQDIGKTDESIHNIHKGLIAMVHKKKDVIEKVFTNTKIAAEETDGSMSSISRARRQNSISGGRRWKSWDECDETMKKAYLEQNSLPTCKIVNNAKEIIMIDPQTKTIIKTFRSMQDTQIYLKLGRATIKDAINHKYLVKNYYLAFK